jgi:hypothetical protein
VVSIAADESTLSAFRDYPAAMIAFYSPDNTRSTKVAVGIVLKEGADPEEMKDWTTVESDLRTDAPIGKVNLDFIELHSIKSVGVTDRIIGRPHEEGVDYPHGPTCPQCPFFVKMTSL